MPIISYELVQKPIEERIIDAACIYWGVERSYFFREAGSYVKTKDSVPSEITYRKSVIYYLIKNNTTYSYDFIAKIFGLKSHQPVIRLIDNLSATKEKIKQHFNDINQIQHLSDKLDASVVQYEIKLVNNKIELKTA